ncbi:MAG: peptidoglycan-binding domain-containing protein, partial [Pseudomonadota bacterium]
PQQAEQRSSQGQNQQQASAQLVAPKSLSRIEVRKMQTALKDQGYKVGKPDGIWGPRTRHAVQRFDQSKGISSKNGGLTQETLAQLGVNMNQQGQ